ncbi:MAG: hypothetical protein WBN03_17250 [Desulfobacterales bacterium]
MNKLDLIQALIDSNHLSKSEAERIVPLFLIKWPTHWYKGTELKYGAFVPH